MKAMTEFYSKLVRNRYETLAVASTTRQAQNVTAAVGPLYRIAMAPRLRLELLGPVRVDVDGVPLVVDTRKATALPAYLAIGGRPASRETLAALLWPESDEAGAHGALRRTPRCSKPPSAESASRSTGARSAFARWSSTLTPGASAKLSPASVAMTMRSRSLCRVPRRARPGRGPRSRGVHGWLCRALQRIRSLAGGRS